MCREVWIWSIAILICFEHVHAHGRMEDPPARNAAWRYGFDVPANYDDVGLNCGGLGVQKTNGGKCGICGDSYTGSRHHENGGKYATNTIVRYYMTGAWMVVKILLSANHQGFMEFRLCSTDSSNFEVTQECLNQNILYIEGFGTQYPVTEGLDLIFLRVQLPEGLSCSQCVLQWRYHAGNNWGVDIQSGRTCLGCGPQEEFYNCADISITSKDNSFLFPPTTTTIASNPLLLFSFNNPVVYPPTVASLPLIRHSTAPESMHFLSAVQLNRNLRCYPTNQALKPLVGIENWCTQLCAVNCPPTLCVCVEM